MLDKTYIISLSWGFLMQVIEVEIINPGVSLTENYLSSKDLIDKNQKIFKGTIFFSNWNSCALKKKHT